MKKFTKNCMALLLSGTLLSGSYVISPVFAETTVETGVECEALYAEWQGSGSYAAYYKTANTDYVKVDPALIRTDGKGGFRAEVLGLKGGTEYTVKIVPVVDGKEDESGAFVFSGTPKSYDRSGYAHFQTTNNPGAYLSDGSLPSNANVVYVNEDNKNTVTLNGKTGIADIISAYNKGNTPLVVRIIGRVTLPSGGIIDKSNKMLGIKGSAGITIEGVGTDSGLYGWGLKVSDGSDAEFRNLHIDWNYEDGIEMQNAKHIWVHDNTFTVGNQNPPRESDKSHGDGSCDAKSSDFITISYNRFIGTAKTCLLGSSPSKRENAGHFSYHHNFWDGTEQRCPRIRWHNVHIYNNYYKNVGYDLDDGSKIGYGIGVTCNSSVFVENNYFENTYRPILTSDSNCEALSTNDGGVVKSFGNYYDENCIGMQDKDRFEATDKYQVLTAADYTASKGGWTYNNFDTSSDFYKDDYFLENAKDCVNTVTELAGTESKTGLTLTNAISGSETGKGDSDGPTAGGSESTTGGEQITGGTLKDDCFYYFGSNADSSAPLDFGDIFKADKAMNISSLDATLNLGDTAYTFKKVAGFGNKSTIKFNAEKAGTLRIVSTSGSTTARKMDITDNSGKNIGQLLSGKNSQAELASVHLDAGSYTITNNGGGEAKLFYIGFSADNGGESTTVTETSTETTTATETTTESTTTDDGGFIYGDATADKELTAADSAVILQKALNNSFSMPIESKTDNWLKYTDTTADNEITAADAAVVLQKALNNAFKMPVERT